MDPNKNLEEQLILAREIVRERNSSPNWSKEEELANLVLALDEWISKGGVLPKRWEEVI